MTTTGCAGLTVSLAESLAFARLSGDFNPLHVDAVTARRLQFGTTVVHGMHLFLRALDLLAAQDLFVRHAPRTLSATFNNPVLTDEVFDLRVSIDLSRVRISGETAGRPALTGTIDLLPSLAAPALVEDAEFAPTNSRVSHFPPTAIEGTVPLRLSSKLLAEIFPALARLGAASWIAELLATTHIVGMRCPGMDSIFSGFRLSRASDSSNPSGSMHFRVTGTEARFRLARMQVAGACFTGTVDTFFRSPPVPQRAMKDIAAVVSVDAFVGHRVLVVGGSRGLGELTAKICAAGGADVTITYARGNVDAERVCEEARALDRTCRAYPLDVSIDGMTNAPEWLARAHFSHVYFFATPHISKGSGRWDSQLFNRFVSIYVTAFAALVEHVMSGHRGEPGSVNFLYPSSIFVTRPEAGFAEYAVAKAAGEALCSQILRRSDVRVAAPRLPRLRTDQTSSLSDTSAVDAFPVILDVVRNLHS